VIIAAAQDPGEETNRGI